MSAGAFSIPLIVRERILDFMSWVLLAVISYTLTAGIAISDKYFLTRRMPSAVSYGFWVGVLGLGFVLAIPFGFYLPEPQTLAAAIASGATQILGTSGSWQIRVTAQPGTSRPVTTVQLSPDGRSNLLAPIRQRL